MNYKIKNLVSVTAGIALATAVALPAFAEDSVSATVQLNRGQDQSESMMGTRIQGRGVGAPVGSMRTQVESQIENQSLGLVKPAVTGLVTAVSGNTVTINGHQGYSTTTATVVYTVDATNATVRKGNATSSVSNIAIGDRVAVQGTVSGTSVVATSIIDGFIPMMGDNRGPRASSTPPFTGNGEPIVAGTISAINGNNLTITTASDLTYTVDATNAKILQGSSTVALSSVTVGEKVVVQGVVNGTSVTASTIIDQRGPVNGRPNDMMDNGQNRDQGQRFGFFGGIGNFFKHLFGF